MAIVAVDTGNDGLEMVVGTGVIDVVAIAADAGDGDDRRCQWTLGMLMGTGVVVAVTVVGRWARLGLIARRHREAEGGWGCRCPLGSC